LSIDKELIMELRQRTGAGIMDSKRALEDSGGDIALAEEVLAEKGLAAAAKRSGREANQGVIEPYIHGGGRIGAIIELNCETDFVARTPEFRNLAHDIAMQVVSMSPTLVGDEEGRSEIMEDSGEEIRLLHQNFVKDESRTIQDLVTEAAAKLGENIKVKRFSRFELGA
jgi:elongation factor Ts